MQRLSRNNSPRVSPYPQAHPHPAGDPEQLLQVMKSFQTQVTDLYTQTESLLTKMRTRHDSMSHGNLMLDELEARINDMVITSSNLDQRWNDVLDINQVAAVLDEMEGLFDHMEDQLRHSREGFEGEECWLCGPRFTAADLSATTLILRLYLLGLDERYFNSKRPLLCDYRRRLLERPGARKLRALMSSLAKTFSKYIAKSVSDNKFKVGAVGLLAFAGAGYYLFKKM